MVAANGGQLTAIAILAHSPILRALTAITWSLLLSLLLLQGEADPVINLGLPRGDNTPARELAFTSLHFLAFALTCAIWFWALHSPSRLSSSLVGACLIAIALGCSTEFLQTFTLDRHFSWLDLGANIAGSLIAARLIWRRHNQHPN